MAEGSLFLNVIEEITTYSKQSVAEIAGNFVIMHDIAERLLTGKP
jgi:hypothetical protein